MLQRRGIDGLVVGPGSNMYYLTGFIDEPSERHLLFVVPAEGDPTFVAPTMYDEQIRNTSQIKSVRLWDDGGGPDTVLEDVLDVFGAGDTILVGDTLWATFLLDLQSRLPGVEFERASTVVGELRMQKDEPELEALRQAATISDQVSRDVRSLGVDAIGMTEAELAAEIDRRLSDAGTTGPAFETIVGSGPNGAHPHHRRSDREIRPGDAVVLDFGATVDQYPGDQTRTVVFDGEPPERFRSVHETVNAALEAGIESVEPGVTASVVDAVVRQVIEDAGYGEFFTHRTGHGVGLDVHEQPYIVEGNDHTLEPGMVFSVEPGIYLDGEFGVRIEDLVVVTEDGCERLNDSPRTWRAL
nr:Xaa-Pro peptidase family protein [Natrononativus amylolyticus]